ncbi:3-hydroxyacyl-CoA dehydrogenase family protein [Pseudarthrobacter sp. SSS035]|uniref:3-hydroxyacyl-CoA dehydrogenase family protein n=1 Tax=Pseudarthrobacter sp. SSS035 TaxID=2931399 RepID=UPI00200CFFF8|nr:3-hydroxyacyl-CoA dehydrogenase family protein [Pseudarthrobacter sp. SSS035]
MTATLVPTEVGVLGGGRMGAGIAHAFCVAGSRVIVIERDAAAAAAARDRVLASLSASVSKGATTESLADLAARVSVGTDYAAFSQAELVIEAVPEDLALKAGALQAIEQNLSETAWLASNTSSISIDLLASGLARPDRFCGMHFFNPVPSSRLVEIVVSNVSDAELARLARGWVAGLKKTAIVVKDSPGFASSRLGLVLGLEAIRMVEEGVASPEDIDAAMVLGYQHPIGPLKLTDIVGLDVRLGIAEYLATTLGGRFEPPALLRLMVKEGRLGRKTGNGFYTWPDGA